MDTIRGHIKRIGMTLAPWTQDRAEKLDNLDNLDVPVSTRADQETQINVSESVNNINSNVGDVSSRNLTSVMGRLGSLVGYGEQEVYSTPGSYTWVVPAGVTKINATIISAGGGGGGGSSGVRNFSLVAKADSRNNANAYPYSIVGELGAGASGGTGAMIKVELSVQPGASISVVVGAGGEGGAGGGGTTTSNGGSGFSGGSSSLAGFVCTGGGGGGGGKASVYVADYTATRMQLATGGTAGQALNTTAAEVKSFKNGIVGNSGYGCHFRITPIRVYSISNNTRYSRHYPKAGVHSPAASKAIPAYNLTDQTSKSFADTPFSIPYFNVTKPISSGKRLDWNVDYPETGKAGDGGVTGDMANFHMSAMKTVADHYDTTVTADDTGTNGVDGSAGHNGIVIIDY